MIIRKMEERDRAAVKEMMRVFYASPAVLSNGSDDIFDADIEGCIGDSPYLEGFVFENESADSRGSCAVGDGEALLGYGMIAKSFSTEFGRPCIWIEDLYLKEDCRGRGIGSKFFDFLASLYPDCIERLEVESENERAIRVYRKNGFEVLPYMEMKKEL